MRKSLLAAGTGLLLMFGASAAYADTVTTDFEGMDPRVGQRPGGLARSPGPATTRGSSGAPVTGCRHPVTQGRPRSVASGSFGDWVFSTPAAHGLQ